MNAPAVEIRQVLPADVLELRQQVLRPMQQLAECVYPGDDDPLAFHGGAFIDDALVGVVSIFPEAGPSGIPEPSYRLRGMAVAPAAQGQGIGRLLLEAVYAHLDGIGFTGVLWCNARVTAGEFYARMGWERIGEIFELPLIGPHVVMSRSFRHLD